MGTAVVYSWRAAEAIIRLLSTWVSVWSEKASLSAFLRYFRTLVASIWSAITFFLWFSRSWSLRTSLRMLCLCLVAALRDITSTISSRSWTVLCLVSYSYSAWPIRWGMKSIPRLRSLWDRKMPTSTSTTRLSRLKVLKKSLTKIRDITCF